MYSTRFWNDLIRWIPISYNCEYMNKLLKILNSKFYETLILHWYKNSKIAPWKKYARDARILAQLSLKEAIALMETSHSILNHISNDDYPSIFLAGYLFDLHSDLNQIPRELIQLICTKIPLQFRRIISFLRNVPNNLIDRKMIACFVNEDSSLTSFTWPTTELNPPYYPQYDQELTPLEIDLQRIQLKVTDIFLKTERNKGIDYFMKPVFRGSNDNFTWVMIPYDELTSTTRLELGSTRINGRRSDHYILNSHHFFRYFIVQCFYVHARNPLGEKGVKFIVTDIEMHGYVKWIYLALVLPHMYQPLLTITLNTSNFLSSFTT